LRIGLRGPFRHGPLLHRRILKHAAALCALVPPRPTPTSAGPGFEAPVNLAYSSRNRSAAFGPHYSPSLRRSGSRSASGLHLQRYLAFAAMLMLGWMESRTRSIPDSPRPRTSTSWARGVEGCSLVPPSLEKALTPWSGSRVPAQGDVFTRMPSTSGSATRGNEK